MFFFFQKSACKWLRRDPEETLKLPQATGQEQQGAVCTLAEAWQGWQGLAQRELGPLAPACRL